MSDPDSTPLGSNSRVPLRPPGLRGTFFQGFWERPLTRSRSELDDVLDPVDWAHKIDVERTFPEGAPSERRTRNPRDR